MRHRDANLVLQYIPVLMYYIVPDPTTCILHWTYTNLILLYYIAPGPTVLHWTWIYLITMNQHCTWSLCITQNLILLYNTKPDPSALQSQFT